MNMTILKILTNNHPLLRTETKEITEPTSRQIKKLAEEMIETMKVKDGLGLAAPQIGQSLKMIVINLKDEATILLNPKITRRSLRKETAEEGCLSLPGVFGLVRRPKTIRLKALDLNGQGLAFKAKGLLARVIQHEVDHLEGILFIDKVVKITKGKIPAGEQL